jgi:hypothetical protein
VCQSPDPKKELLVPVPKYNEEDNEIESITCESKKKLSKDQKAQLGLDIKHVLENCEITVLENNKVVCFKCMSDFFYDGAAQKCRRRKEYSTMQGCALTYDNVNCMFCQDNFQLDFSSGKCISKSEKIDFSKLDSGMGPQYQLENQDAQQREEQMNSQMYNWDQYNDEREEE